ncbi:MAG: methyltransferase, partial [Flavobacterium sp.]|nr:methyltransferase [Flavobacterium sp.]
MKVGTDGVLLGAWAPIYHNPQSILDIGTGTGLIALMLAQRTDAHQIDAVDIDDDAYEQAVENFENSPWGERLFCYHAGLDEFIEEPEDEYDLIVSNPPFYTEDYSSGDEQRDQARFSASMPFSQIIEAADLMLSEHGVFAVIIPFKEEAAFVETAKEYELYPFKITRVKGTPTTEIKRSLLAFSRN